MENTNHQQNDSLKEYLKNEECKILKIAINQMNIHIFVYDICLKKLYFFSDNNLPFASLDESECSVIDIVSKDLIDSEYIKDFITLFKDIDNGKKKTDKLIKLNDANSSWSHVMLINTLNSRAIGTIQDVSNRVETEMRYARERQYRMAMMADSRRVYEINVTKDRFIMLESIQDSTDYGTWNVYTKAMDKLRINHVYRGDWESFLTVANRDNLIENYRKGVNEFYCEYRFIDNNGDISWVSSSTHLLKDPLSDDIKGFIYVKDIDRQKRHELELCKQVELDPLTGIYNRRTAEKLITQTLETSNNAALHAFLIIDFDDFKVINDNFGHLKGDHLLKQMALEVSNIVGDKNIFARIGGDEFIVFIKNAHNIDHIKGNAERIRNCIHNISINNYSPTVSIGISLYPKNGITFEDLYNNSDAGLYKAKASGKNKICDYYT